MDQLTQRMLILVIDSRVIFLTFLVIASCNYCFIAQLTDGFVCGEKHLSFLPISQLKNLSSCSKFCLMIHNSRVISPTFLMMAAFLARAFLF